MTPDEIEDLAFRGTGMPSGLDAAEQMLFQSFRRLYDYAKLTHMPEDRGRMEKAEILNEFKKRKFQVKRLEHADQLWKRIEAAADQFAHEKTIENAEVFVNAVYGLMPVQKGGLTENGNG